MHTYHFRYHGETIQITGLNWQDAMRLVNDQPDVDITGYVWAEHPYEHRVFYLAKETT